MTLHTYNVTGRPVTGHSAPLATAVRRFMAHQVLRPARLTLPPGVVVIGPDDTIRYVTSAVGEWLRLLSSVAPVTAERPNRTEHLKHLTRNIVVLARRAGHLVASHFATQDGWISVHGQPLGRDEAGAIVVTYQQAAAATLLPTATNSSPDSRLTRRTGRPHERLGGEGRRIRPET